MCKAANEAGVINMVAFNYRRTPAVALAKEFIDEGRIGDVVNFRGTYLQDWSADPDGPYPGVSKNQSLDPAQLATLEPMSLTAHYLVGPITEVSSIMKTYVQSRPIQDSGVDKLGASDKTATPHEATLMSMTK